MCEMLGQVPWKDKEVRCQQCPRPVWTAEVPAGGSGGRAVPGGMALGPAPPPSFCGSCCPCGFSLTLHGHPECVSPTPGPWTSPLPRILNWGSNRHIKLHVTRKEALHSHQAVLAPGTFSLHGTAPHPRLLPPPQFPPPNPLQVPVAFTAQIFSHPFCCFHP